MPTIRLQLPAHLQTLARHRGELTLDVPAPPTLGNTLDALEGAYPQLAGPSVIHDTLKRRPFLRFFACNEDISHEPPISHSRRRSQPPAEPLLIIGAIAGG